MDAPTRTDIRIKERGPAPAFDLPPRTGETIPALRTRVASVRMDSRWFGLDFFAAKSAEIETLEKADGAARAALEMAIMGKGKLTSQLVTSGMCLLAAEPPTLSASPAAFAAWGGPLPASSPSSDGCTILDLRFAILEQSHPLWLELEAGDRTAVESFRDYCSNVTERTGGSSGASSSIQNSDKALAEKGLYPIAHAIRPSWTMVISGGVKTASELFPEGSRVKLLNNLLSCQPELALRCSERRVPGFNGELKTMGNNKRLYDGVATHVLFDMGRSFFTTWEKGQADPTGANELLFYSRPPLGFALAGAPPVGWIISLELVGRLFMSVFSQPFFLGSKEHVAAIKALPKPTYADPVDISGDWSRREIWDCNPKGDVCWTKSPSSGGYFLKRRLWSSADPEFLKRTARSYIAYNKARSAESSAASSSSATSSPSSIPSSLCQAELFFGLDSLLIRMPFLHGRHPTQDELSDSNSDSELISSMATALLWLALRDLLYTDLRPPNIFLRDAAGAGAAAAGKQEVFLVDYDDMRIVPGLGEKLRAGEGLGAIRAAFQEYPGPGVEINFLNGSCKGLEAALAKALVQTMGAAGGTSVDPDQDTSLKRPSEVSAEQAHDQDAGSSKRLKP
jgi:hypothetical protein